MLIKLRANAPTRLVVAAIFATFSYTTVISAVRIRFNAKLFDDVDIT